MSLTSLLSPGISAAKILRFTARKPAGTGVDIFYTDNCMKTGWMPRPLLPVQSFGWKKFCKHPTKPTAMPRRMLHHYPLVEKGRRQEWAYRIEFNNGTIHDIILKCPSLPCGLTLESVQNDIMAARPQTFEGTLL